MQKWKHAMLQYEGALEYAATPWLLPLGWRRIIVVICSTGFELGGGL
jgi:hypothetical protein